MKKRYGPSEETPTKTESTNNDRRGFLKAICFITTSVAAKVLTGCRFDKSGLSNPYDASNQNNNNPDAAIDAQPINDGNIDSAVDANIENDSSLHDSSIQDSSTPDAEVLDSSTPDSSIQDSSAPDAQVDATVQNDSGPTVENCTNGIDDDGDGMTDCWDPDCSSTAECAGENCQTPGDDELDGAAKCQDVECVNTAACNIWNVPCVNQGKKPGEACTSGAGQCAVGTCSQEDATHPSKCQPNNSACY